MMKHWKMKLSVSLIPIIVISGQLANKEAVVFGSIVNGSSDSSAVTNQEVILYQYIDGQEVKDFTVSTVTNSNGDFFFKGLEASKRYSYYPITVYDGVEYSGVLVIPTPSKLRLQSDILIFESTSSDSTISTIMHHLIIEPGVGSLNVREVLLFANRDNHTYIGNIPTKSGKNIVLRMETPVRANEVQVGGDVMSCCTIVKGNQIFDTMAFKPGTRQAVLSYVLSYDGREANLTKTVEYRTEAFDIFLSDPLRLAGFTTAGNNEENKIISKDQLEESEPFQIRGKKYNRYNIGSLARGSTFSLAISQEDASQNLSALQTDYRWLAPIILILIIVVGYFSNHKRTFEH